MHIAKIEGFSRKEQGLVEDRDFFIAKAAITQKVKTQLHRIHRDLEAAAASETFLAPEDFDLRTHQFVKGEHLHDFPYLYLDFPKFFTRKEKFTFRSLFWWGHFFVFSWILEGPHLERYKTKLLAHYGALADQGLFVLMADSLWEWRKDPGNLLEIRGDNQDAVASALHKRPFLKLHRYIAFDHPAVSAGDLNETALGAFRLMLPIVADR